MDLQPYENDYATILQYFPSIVIIILICQLTCLAVINVISNYKNEYHHSVEGMADLPLLSKYWNLIS